MVRVWVRMKIICEEEGKVERGGCAPEVKSGVLVHYW